jgi:hypothetical protein
MFCVPHGGKLYEEDQAEAWTFSTEDAQQEALKSVEGPMAELRDIGVTSFTLAVILERRSDIEFPLQYPSLTRYREDRTYSSAQLDRVFALQQTITVLVTDEIWGVVPAIQVEDFKAKNFARVRDHRWNDNNPISGSLRAGVPTRPRRRIPTYCNR